MSAIHVPPKTLPSGAKIPVVGLGVYLSEPGAETYDAVLSALKLGYRHIDTAQYYANEADVGKAVRDSGIPRDQVFVTSKLFLTNWGYDKAIAAVKESNEKLGLGYIDLFLLHAPGDAATRAETWRALEDLQTQGVLRDIGVSNFGEAHLKKLAETWKAKPAVNQVELHPWLTRADLVEYHKQVGIPLEAYSPLAKANKLVDPVVNEIAAEVKATPAQVLIAWSLAKDFITLPKSVNPDRQKLNLEAVNVKLSDAQVAKLDALDEYLTTGWDPIKEHAV
uniref:NADP-dependent oxidoreductase domain-containing protein n=1 Tax=Globisporangium ultimum (strain ATCC 200006 / CBS 805.95 / DAOM BR144) TaxID=431595 RepID=K3WD22_GLOUD